MSAKARARIVTAGVVAALLACASCVPGAGAAVDAYAYDADIPTTFVGGDDAGSSFDVDLGDPFAIVGLSPSHGPWTGGTRVVISGRGFSSKVQVSIGNA